MSLMDIDIGKRVSSPTATGGAGTTFEQHVGAYWLAQLLARGIPPILIDTTVSEVSFQTERLGWQTDDFLIVCDKAGAVSNRLFGQVKRNFTVSSSDEECVKTIADFWKDHKNANFVSENDRFALVTLRGTNTLLEHFAGLLDCARASRNSAEFEQRLATEGLVSKTAVRYCDELKKIIGKIDGKSVALADIWSFLRVLHVLSLDLHNSTRQTEAHIRTLLALTVNDGDPASTAAASWNELISEASTGMAESRSLRRTDLPKGLQDRHRAIDVNEQRILQALKDHTKPVLRGIRSNIGNDLHLPRAALVQKVLESLETTQVVIVTGPAGSGKSAICKDAINRLAANHFVFGFRVEEFAQPHFDATLATAQVPARHTTLTAILAAQDRKAVLVESVERLLERTTRDAFTDLMTLVADDGGMRVVLTCRDYSLELVRASFLHGINYTVVRVPFLNDAELAIVEKTYPVLALPLRSANLRNILRNPFLLDKALVIQWSSEARLPKNEREFRTVFWREIVRADHHVVAGMGRRREEALQEIAVRRARALSPYVPVTDLDPAVIASLQSDSLLISAEDNPSLVGTAHDVLEDWAILQWLEEQSLAEASFGALACTIGEHPAIRRSYRKWVAELVDRNAQAADRLFDAAVSDTNISVQFRDDTLVALLKAPSAPEFITRHSAQLLANDRVLLKRMIHLLRVACVKAPDWLPSTVKSEALFSVPDGSAWAAILCLVHQNLSNFAPNERLLLISLIQDSVKGVSWWAPNVEGAEYIAGIAYWLLSGMRGYGSEDVRKRVLQVIAKIPKADAKNFEAVLRGHIEEDERRDMASEELLQLIYNGFDGMPASRDLPDLVINVGEEYLLATEEDIPDNRGYSPSSLDIDLYFGIKSDARYNSHPASAIRGPWGYLLRYHTAKALDFYIKVSNHSTEWYVRPRIPGRLEPPFEVELKFSDGTSKKQWANGRFWGLYRGLSVGPHIFESMLMALESWLFEVAKQAPEKLDSILLDLLRRSDNAALTAVVASIATAHPHACGEALLVILSARDYIDMDRSRMAAESGILAFSGIFPVLGAEQKIYEAERKEANNRPHRGEHLETAILNLQLGPLAKCAQAILDEHLTRLPPKDQQDEEDRIWRLAIHRMDFRQLTVTEIPAPDVPEEGEPANENSKRYVRLDPKPVDADVQEMIDKNTGRITKMNLRLGIKLWGIHAFRRENGKYDPAQWAAKIAEAKTIDRDNDEGDGTRNGPGFIAAACVRDHWEEMSSDQKDWCVDVVCSEVSRHADSSDRMHGGSLSADRPCAFVLVLLLQKKLTDAQMQRVRETFAIAMTHRSDEVRQYTIFSIDEKIWAEDRSLALLCINAIATESDLLSKAQEVEDARPYSQRRHWGEIVPEIVSEVRARFWKRGAIADDAHITAGLPNGFGGSAFKNVLTILGRVPQDPLAVAAHLRAANTLAECWKIKEDRDRRRDRDHRAEALISERIQEFLMRTSSEAAKQIASPILDAMDCYPREIHNIIQGLTSAEDRQPNTEHYWLLWELFAERVKSAKWLTTLDHGRRSTGGEVLSTIFLTAFWKEDIRHWRSLEGYDHHVGSLFEALPATWLVLDSYVRFLYHIGERSMPEAFVRVAGALKRGDAQKMLAESNTIFMLEALLRRHVYGRPLELKRQAPIRNAVFFILDCLVESGSSAAFRMRDDFVTPGS